MKKLLIGALIAFAATSALWPDEPAGSGKRMIAHKITVGDLSRTYYLHVPPNLPGDKAAALVLMFHGGGGTPKFASRDSKLNDLADREGFLAAYPEGIGKSWNDGRGAKSIPAQRKNVDDVAFVAALIDDIDRSRKVDAKRVYATGISNGATFSHHLAANLSTRIAAIAPVAGGLSEPESEKFKPEVPVSVLILQGTADPIVPYNGGGIFLPGIFKRERGRIVGTDAAVKRWVEHDGCQRDPVSEDLPDEAPADGCRVKKSIYAKGKNGTDVVLYRLEGGGHTWPGGLQYLPERFVGKVCRDINATGVIWEFFKTHPKP
jgi:polyhydroxybutyrate depolymerase